MYKQEAIREHVLILLMCTKKMTINVLLYDRKLGVFHSDITGMITVELKAKNDERL